MTDDAALIDRLIEGESDAIATVRSWIRSAFTPYRRRLGSEAEDIEQDVLLQVGEAVRAERFRGESSFRTYIRTMVHHKCIDRIRAGRRRQWVDVDTLDLPSREPSALERLAREEEQTLAHQVLAEVPEGCRELWQMLEEGLKYKEMSERLGVAEGTLRARILRCRQRAVEIRRKIIGNKTGTGTTRNR